MCRPICTISLIKGKSKLVVAGITIDITLQGIRRIKKDIPGIPTWQIFPEKMTICGGIPFISDIC
jgi:hypothetical protein